jgi:hypothetical protein
MRWRRVADGRRRRRGRWCGTLGRRGRWRRALRGRPWNGGRRRASAIGSYVDRGGVVDHLFDDDRGRRRLLHRSCFDGHKGGGVVARRHLVARERQRCRCREKAGQPYRAADSAQCRQANHSNGAVTRWCVVTPTHHSSPAPGDGDGDECAGGDGEGCGFVECPSLTRASLARPLPECSVSAGSGAEIGALGTTGRSYMSTTLWTTAGAGAG